MSLHGSKFASGLLVSVSILICALVLIGAYLAPLAAQTSSVSEVAPVAGDSTTGTKIGVVTTEDTRLNVRSGPGLTYSVIGKLMPGTQVEIVGAAKNNGWYQVRAASLKDAGWVAAEFVQVMPAAAITEPSNSLQKRTQNSTISTGATQVTMTTSSELAAGASVTSATPVTPVQELQLAPTHAITPHVTVPTAADVVGSLPGVTYTTTPSGEMGIQSVTVPAPGAGVAFTLTATATSVATSAAAISTAPSAVMSAVSNALAFQPSSAVTPALTPAATENTPRPVEPVSTTVTAMVSRPEVADAALLPTLTPTSVQMAMTQALPTPAPTATPTPEPTPSIPTAVTQPSRMNVRSGPSTNYDVITSVAQGTALRILALSPDGAWYQVHLDGQARPGWLYGNLTKDYGPLTTLGRLSKDQIPPEPTPRPTPVAAAVASAPAGALPPAGVGTFGYGIQAHMLAGQAGPALDAVSRLGFNWVKQQVVWATFEPAPGGRGFGELQGIVAAAGGRGLNVLFSVVSAPAWAREPGFDGGVGGPPADPQTFANFVGDMASQFCGSALKAIEVWNEENLNYEWGNKPLNPADYMALMRGGVHAH